VLVAAFIAVSPDPLVRWLIAPKIKRSRAVALILTVIALLLAGLGYATICHSSTRGISSVRTSLVTWNICASVRRASRARRTNFNIQPKIESWAHQAPSILAHEGVRMGTRFFGALVTTLLVVVLTIYFMADLPRLRRAIVRLFPKRHRAGRGDRDNRDDRQGRRLHDRKPDHFADRGR
jgi:predicted PurR-regulated permease PerM